MSSKMADLLKVFLVLMFLVVGLGCQVVNEEVMRGRMEQVLYEAVVNEDARLRCHGLESLAELGGSEAAVVIRGGMEDEAAAVRLVASVAAGDIMDQQSRSVLERLLGDESEAVRLAAGYGLEKLGDRRFGSWYDEALNGEDVQLAGLSCMLLGKLGDREIRLVLEEKLWGVLEKSGVSAAGKLQAAEALARLGDERVLRRLLSYAASGYADDRLLAISGLEQLGGEDAYSMLAVLTDDALMEVRLAAIRALGSRAEFEDLELARQGMSYPDKSGDAVVTARVRGLAALALGRIGEAEDGRLLYEAMKGGSRYVQIAAARGMIDFLQRYY
ncbi:MAG: HEAT repeat domain-containing protein [Planctomycetes bacterium]|nr:HEAT repeat domain-containing protein [Planctomycetota bacterium]